MKRSLALLVLAGCGESDPLAPTPDVSGTWAYDQVVEESGTTCGDGGEVSFRQNGSALSGILSGRGGCQNRSLAIDYIRQSELDSADIVGTTLRFTAGACRYEGSVVGRTVTQAGGTVTCTNLASTGLTLAGTWELRR